MALSDLGKTVRKAGRAEEALYHLVAALDSIETQQERLGGGGEARGQFRQEYIGRYREAVDLLLELGRHQDSLGILERSRAQGLLALLAERDIVFSADVPAELERERRIARADYQRLLDRMARRRLDERVVDAAIWAGAPREPDLADEAHLRDEVCASVKAQLEALHGDVGPVEWVTEADPEHAETYRSRLAAFEEELDVLDREIRARLADLPNRHLYVYHPAWGYFCEAYGLSQVPVEIAGQEPSEIELTRLVARAREDEVRVIFVQPQIAGQAAQALARTVGARVERLDPLARDVVANLRAVAELLAGGKR